MTERLHAAAQADTPANVEVPPTPFGVAAWMVGKFGAGALMAAAAIYGLTIVYTDLKQVHEKLIGIVEKRSEADLKLALALTDMSDALRRVSEDAKQAHKSVTKVP